LANYIANLEFEQLNLHEIVLLIDKYFSLSIGKSFENIRVGSYSINSLPHPKAGRGNNQSTLKQVLFTEAVEGL
jgi:hypothetical protein